METKLPRRMRWRVRAEKNVSSAFTTLFAVGRGMPAVSPYPNL